MNSQKFRNFIHNKKFYTITSIVVKLKIVETYLSSIRDNVEILMRI